MFAETITSENGSEYQLIYEANASGIAIKGISPKDVKDVVIPSEIDGLPVTSIGDRAFFSCHGLTSITIPNSVTHIGHGVFSYCTGLTSINIPDSVTSIGSRAFCDCAGLTSITIPDSVTSISDFAFYGCTDLTSVCAPSVQYVGELAFSGCGLLRNVELAPDACWENSAFICSGLEDEYCYNEEER